MADRYVPPVRPNERDFRRAHGIDSAFDYSSAFGGWQDIAKEQAEKALAERTAARLAQQRRDSLLARIVRRVTGKGK